jgi:hypothetical protein
VPLISAVFASIRTSLASKRYCLAKGRLTFNYAANAFETVAALVVLRVIICRPYAGLGPSDVERLGNGLGYRPSPVRHKELG